MNIGLVSARGGSVRFKDKNITPLAGVPLFMWSIYQLVYSKLTDFVIFTTDSQHYWDLFEKHVPDEMRGKCHVILRPVWDNNTAVNRPYRHAIETLREQGVPIKDTDNVITLFPTSPQRHPHDVDNLIQAWYDVDGKYDQLSWFAPERECFVYKNLRPMEGRYGIPYGVEPVITDKFWTYSTMAGGNAIYSIGKAMEWWSEWSDRDLDKRMRETQEKRKIGAFSVYPYQAMECDYEHQFHIIEAIMEKVILKGRGVDIYRDYYEGHI